MKYKDGMSHLCFVATEGMLWRIAFWGELIGQDFDVPDVGVTKLISASENELIFAIGAKLRCRECGGRFDYPGLYGCEEPSHVKPDVAHKIVAAIERNLTDRRGFSWDGVSENTQHEMRMKWCEMIRALIEQELPKGFSQQAVEQFLATLRRATRFLEILNWQDHFQGNEKLFETIQKLRKVINDEDLLPVRRSEE